MIWPRTQISGKEPRLFRLRNNAAASASYQVNEQLLVKPVSPEILMASAGAPPVGNILVYRKGGDLVVLDQLTGRQKGDLWLIVIEPLKMPVIEGQAYTGDGVNYTFKLELSLQASREPVRLQKLLYTYQPLTKLLQTIEREIWLLFQNYYYADLAEQAEDLTNKAKSLSLRKSNEVGLDLPEFNLTFAPSN